MRFVLMSLVTFVSSLALAVDGRLHFDDGKLAADYTWKLGPYANAESQLQVVFIDTATGAAMEPNGNFAVSLFMPSHGHGAPPVRIDHVAGPGIFDVSSMYFVMPGTWEVRMTLKGPNARVETQKIAVEIVGLGGHPH